MIHARIEHGHVQLEDPIPPEWEGQRVKITPLSPDDPIPDLEERLAALHALGAMEYEPGEREAIAAAMAELDTVSKAVTEALSLPRP
jgi:hypothetical protein